jgi:hypothetical protein
LFTVVKEGFREQIALGISVEEWVGGPTMRWISGGWIALAWSEGSEKYRVALKQLV